MSMFCFRNGDIVPNDEATVHISDLGLLRSYAAFDYLRTYNGRPFCLSDHLARFRHSANELMLPLKYSNEEIGDTVRQLLEKSQLKEAGIRLVITGGNSPDGMTIAEPNFFIIVEALQQHSQDCWTKGVKLITNEYLRDQPDVKSTGYLNAIRLMPQVRSHGAHDILYCHNGQVLELTRNNFFLFKGNVLVTPKEDVLPGITRKVLLELCKSEFPIEERIVGTGELAEADEAFLSGTTKGVMPVVQVDDTVIGNGRVGVNTRRVMTIFERFTERN